MKLLELFFETIKKIISTPNIFKNVIVNPWLSTTFQMNFFYRSNTVQNIAFKGSKRPLAYGVQR